MNNKGVTLVGLITTIVLLLILTGIIVTFTVDKKVVNSANDIVNKSEKQQEEHNTMADEVRDLYN